MFPEFKLDEVFSKHHVKKLLFVIFDSSPQLLEKKDETVLFLSPNRHSSCKIFILIDLLELWSQCQCSGGIFSSLEKMRVFLFTKWSKGKDFHH